MELFSRDDCPALAGEPAVSSSQIMLWRDATGLILFDIAKVSSGAAFFDFLFQKKGLFSGSYSDTPDKFPRLFL